MNVLVACEESQRVCAAFREKGHNAFSCDILPCSGGHPEWHIQGDVLKIINPEWYDGRWGITPSISFETMDGDYHQFDGKWDIIIAFPPCTHLSSSGQWAYSKGKDVSLREEAAEFFMMFANADCERIAIENPVGIMSSRWRKPNQIVHPWQFGHNAEKQTCLWLKGLPNLVHDIKEKPELEYFDWRAEIASKTFPGIAKAMADQWG